MQLNIHWMNQNLVLQAMLSVHIFLPTLLCDLSTLLLEQIQAMNHSNIQDKQYMFLTYVPTKLTLH